MLHQNIQNCIKEKIKTIKYIQIFIDYEIVSYFMRECELLIHLERQQ